MLPKSLILSGPDGEQKIGPNMMELLLVFVENQGQILNTERLHQQVWKDVVVSDGTIRKTISNLKYYFTIDGKCYLDIQAIRSQGYKLSEDVAIQYSANKIGLISILSHKWTTVGITLIGIFLIGFFSLKWYQNQLAAKIHFKNSGVARSPELAENGKKMVYSGSSDQQNIEDIFLYDFETQESETLVSSPYVEVHPTITTDAKFVAYIANRSNQPNGLYELDVSSKKERLLINIDYPSPLRSIDWSPNGRILAISLATQKDPTYRIYQLDREHLTTSTTTNPHKKIFGDINPKYSPYGDSLAFIRTQSKSLYYDFLGGVGDIYVQDLKTHQLQKVTLANSEITGLDWSEDGKKIFYIVMNESMNFEIREADLQSSAEKTIYSSEKVLRNLSVNNKLIFESYDIVDRFIEISIGNEMPINFKYIDLENGKYWYPTYGNVDNKLVYISTQSGFPELWFKELGQSQASQITAFKGAYIGKPKWSHQMKR